MKPGDSSNRCTICEGDFALIEWHHTVPQAFGGVDSLQIPLCGTCHSSLHAHADAIVAMILRGTKFTRRFWMKESDAHRAQQFIAIIVDATLYKGEVADKGFKMTFTASREIHKGLRLLKQDLQGITNLPDTILYCVVETLKTKGLYNDSIDKKHPTKSSKSIIKPTHDLW